MYSTDTEVTSLFKVDTLLFSPAQSIYTQLEAWNITVLLYREWVDRGQPLGFLPPYYTFSDRLEGTKLMFQDFDLMEKIAEGRA